MRSEKYVKERKVRDWLNKDEVERAINDLIMQMFRDMMHLNLVAEGETLRFEIQEIKEEDIMSKGPLNQMCRKANIRIQCIMREATSRRYEPEAIYRNGKNTTVKWEDGTITTVKLAKDEQDSNYTAFTAALAIKTLGTNTRIKKILDKKTVIQKKKAKVRHEDLQKKDSSMVQAEGDAEVPADRSGKAEA
jgi:hypothetical protein